MSQKATKGLTALTPKIDCNQTAIGLPPVTSVSTVLVTRGSLGGIFEMPLLPLRGWGVSGMYVCMYVSYEHRYVHSTLKEH
jgi:hypothetical protein